ncbi:hypothetical protein BC829DRAFT_478841 [Chytridium lagenaria]|nr:hypothetical protein BC829DRAFT_478841 [Chytridium lagenaria]
MTRFWAIQLSWLVFLLFLCQSLMLDRKSMDALPLAGFASYIAAEVLEDETLMLRYLSKLTPTDPISYHTHLNISLNNAVERPPSFPNIGGVYESCNDIEAEHSRKKLCAQEARIIIEIDHLIVNVSIQVEQERKEANSDARLINSFLLLSADLSADVCALKSIFDVAVHRYSELRQILKTKMEIEACGIWGPHWQLRTLYKRTQTLLAMGEFQVAQNSAIEGKHESIELKSLPYNLKFHGAELIARLRNVIKKPRQVVANIFEPLKAGASIDETTLPLKNT